MPTVWHNVETSRSVAIELARIGLRRYVVEMFTRDIAGARHSTAYVCRSSCHSVRHSCTPCWRIQRTQGCSVGKSCLQFHRLMMMMLSFVSRQRHYHQPRNHRQKLHWCHCCVLRTTISCEPCYWRCPVSLAIGWLATADNTVNCLYKTSCDWLMAVGWNGIDNLWNIGQCDFGQCPVSWQQSGMTHDTAACWYSIISLPVHSLQAP